MYVTFSPIYLIIELLQTTLYLMPITPQIFKRVSMSGPLLSTVKLPFSTTE